MALIKHVRILETQGAGISVEAAITKAVFMYTKFNSLVGFAALLLFTWTCFAQAPTQITAPNGLSFPVAARDRGINNDELIIYSVEFYKKNSSNQFGVDVFVADDKVVGVQDRAGAVYIQNKPDPGPVATATGGYVLSGNGVARKWILANLKIGDVVSTKARDPNKEALPPASIPCFAGSYYRKAVTSYDAWTGIAGFAKLGVPKVDETRLDPETKQPLDNFSVYLGGNAGGSFEVDAGLTWEFTLDETGKKSERRNAYRPFWRTKTWNAAPAQKEYYFYPGETVQMALIISGPKKLRLVISNGKEKTFQTEFDAEGFAPNVIRQFKRVNAIDQVHNEGKPVQPTNAQVTGAEWNQTILLRGAGTETRQIPMDKTRFTDMRCTDEKFVVATPVDAAKGAEKIDIFGTPKN